MKQSSVISPSILSADFARLGEDTQAEQPAHGAAEKSEYLHKLIPQRFDVR